MKCLALFLLLFSFSATAEIPCGFVHKADFKEATAGLKELGKPLSFLSAAVHIGLFSKKTDKDPSGSCSGAYVSDDGTILTASHCFDECRFHHETGELNGVKTCYVDLNGSRQEVEILKASSCPFGLKEMALKDLSRGSKSDDLPKGCRNGDLDDMAVIRPTKVAALKAFACLPVATSDPALNESVFTMGNPAPTYRRHNMGDVSDSSGDRRMVSSGKVIESNTCEQLWQAQGIARLWYGSKKYPEQKEISGMGAMGIAIQTTVDAVQGSSGGPLINQNGEVAGVVSFGMAAFHNAYHECKGATFFQRVSKWADYISPKPSSCSQRRASQGESL